MNILFIGNGFDLEHECMPKILHKNFIDYLRQKSKKYKSIFSDDNYKSFSSGKNCLWSEFENFCNWLNLYKKKYSFYNRLSIHFDNWLDSLNIDYKNFRKSALIEKIFNKYNFVFILSFNYTNTAKEYGYDPYFFNFDSKKSDWNISNFLNKCINLHKFNSGKKFKYILGSDEEKQYNKNWLISKWENKKNFNPKKIVFNEILNDINISFLYFYGFSFGKSDKETILFLKEFIKKFPNNRKIFIFLKKDLIDSKEIIQKNLFFFLTQKLAKFFEFIEI